MPDLIRSLEGTGTMPDFKFESRVYRETGVRWVCGIDEVGVGALAGPLVAAAVAFPSGWAAARVVSTGSWLGELDDSKRLLKSKVYRLAEAVRGSGYAHIGIGLVVAQEFDRLGMIGARAAAMKRAYADLCRGLGEESVGAVIDDPRMSPFEITGQAPAVYAVHADARSLSVAAASIVAKAARDAYMTGLAQLCRGYGFETNAGYGTTQHYKAIREYGLTAWHRRSFRLGQEKHNVSDA